MTGQRGPSRNRWWDCFSEHHRRKICHRMCKIKTTTARDLMSIENKQKRYSWCRFTPICARVFPCRMWKETVGFLLLLLACVDSSQSRRCLSFFCRKSHPVSGPSGVDPGSPLFLTPYLEKGAVDEGNVRVKRTIIGDTGIVTLASLLVVVVSRGPSTQTYLTPLLPYIHT